MCERNIEEGWKTFLSVGRALTTIRDGNLYRDSNDTFESYCSDRWGYVRSYAYRLIDAARVAQILSPNGDIPRDLKEAHLRSLAGLDEGQVREVWGKVNKDFPTGKITSRVVGNCVREMYPAPAPTLPKKIPAARKAPDVLRQVSRKLTEMVNLARVTEKEHATQLRADVLAILRSMDR